MANDFPRRRRRRSHLGIELEAVGSWYRRESVIVEISVQAFRRRHLPPLDVIRSADPARGLLPGAVQEPRKQFAAAPPHDLFEFLVLGKVLRLGVAEGRDHKPNAMLRGGVEGIRPDGMHELPKPGSAEIEYRTCEIDGCVVVEQPPRTIPSTAFATVSLPVAGEPWRKSSFMRDEYRESLKRARCRDQEYAVSFPGCCAARRALRRGALLIRGPSSAWVPALRSSAKSAAPRPGHEAHPRANIRASLRSTGATAPINRAAASSTLSPAVSTTAEARA